MSSPEAEMLLALLGDVTDGHILDGVDGRTLVVLPRLAYAEIARRVDNARARAAEQGRDLPPGL